jgi:hypothetical protein
MGKLIGFSTGLASLPFEISPAHPERQRIGTSRNSKVNEDVNFVEENFMGLY